MEYTCKHCGLAIEDRGLGWVHAEGLQARMTNCAVYPYGFHAEPEGTECCDDPANRCNGARGVKVQRVAETQHGYPSPPRKEATCPITPMTSAARC